MNKVIHYRCNIEYQPNRCKTHLACTPSEILPANTGLPKGSSRNTREVTCRECLSSKEFQTAHKKALKKPLHYLYLYLHKREDGSPTGQLAYLTGCGTSQPLFFGGASENPGTTGKVEEVTCSNCLRTKAYQEGIELLKDDACGIRAKRMELKRELAEIEGRLRALRALGV